MMTARSMAPPHNPPTLYKGVSMQKRNIRGVEQVIYKATQKLKSDEQGPSNKGLSSLAQLISAFERATRPNLKPGRHSGLSDEEFMCENGDAGFYDSLTK